MASIGEFCSVQNWNAAKGLLEKKIREMLTNRALTLCTKKNLMRAVWCFVQYEQGFMSAARVLRWPSIITAVGDNKTDNFVAMTGKETTRRWGILNVAQRMWRVVCKMKEVIEAGNRLLIEKILTQVWRLSWIQCESAGHTAPLQQSSGLSNVGSNVGRTQSQNLCAS
jgi:hypothetical protein